jgi:hypothetical protein
MTNNLLTLFCLVDREATTNAFPVEIESTKTIGDLKELIKTKKTNDFQDVDADKLTIWRVSIPDKDDDETPIKIDNVPESEKKKLRATNKVSVIGAALPESTIHVIVQPPPRGNAMRFAFDSDVRLELFNTTIRSLINLHFHLLPVATKRDREDDAGEYSLRLY